MAPKRKVVGKGKGGGGKKKQKTAGAEPPRKSLPSAEAAKGTPFHTRPVLDDDDGE